MRKTEREILIGERFNYWLVIGYGSKPRKFLCKCDCGKEREVYRYGLIAENPRRRSSSCGCKPRPDKQRDITNLVSGKLKAVKVVGRKNGNILWECKCECGNTAILTTSKLLYRKQLSCGCTQYGAGTLPKGQAAFNRVLDRYKRGAKERGLMFSLTKEQFYILTQQSCFYCDGKPIKIYYNKSVVMNGNFSGNGVDRMNNKEGYTLDNSVPCCEICNRAKRAMSLDDFNEWIIRLCNHTYKKENKLIAV